MTQGVLIFAFNNTVHDYLGQANWVADRVNKYLDLPVSIITDTKSTNNRTFKHNLILTDALSGGRRNFDIHQTNKIGNWYNVNRFQSYDLTPYDETVVIDSDYIVNSDQLLRLFESKHNVMCHRNVYDVTGRNSFSPYKTFGKYNFPHYWATVLHFKKSKEAEEMFQLMTMILNNYEHYSDIYNFRVAPFRNDYAVSIALSILNGHRLSAIHDIPWAMPSVNSDATLEQLDETKFCIRYEKWVNNKKRPFKCIVKDTDLHFINKFAIQEVIDA